MDGIIQEMVSNFLSNVNPDNIKKLLEDFYHEAYSDGYNDGVTDVQEAFPTEEETEDYLLMDEEDSA